MNKTHPFIINKFIKTFGLSNADLLLVWIISDERFKQNIRESNLIFCNFDKIFR